MAAPASRLRLGVYCDYSYRVGLDGNISAELPFALFLEGLAARLARLVAVGRLDPDHSPYPFVLRAVELLALPHYASGADMGAVLRSLPVAGWRFWRALEDLDVVWILGPNPPQTLLFAALAVLRRRRVVLGVRQNLPELIRHRRPGRRAVIAAAKALEAGFRLLARGLPVVVVGPDLARHYRGARRLCEIYVSLLPAARLAEPPPTRDYAGPELVMLSVGRLDPEKNPLLLAEVLAAAVARDPRWRLEVCGDGPLAGALAARAAALGVGDRLSLRGYVPVDGGLWDHYRRAHALVHVSLTEGVPQVILEAFAAGLPVVATDVGGVGALMRGRGAGGPRGYLVPPRSSGAIAEALARLVADGAERGRLVAAARTAAAAHTLEAETERLAGFLSMNS